MNLVNNKMDIYCGVKEWLKSYKKQTVKPATYDRMMISLKLMSKYAISFIKIEDISSDSLQQYVNTLQNDGYAKTTIRKQYVLLAAFLKYCHSQNIISSPIYMSIMIPKESNVIKHKKQIETYSFEEQTRLKQILRSYNHISYVVAILMLEAGLRVGEALAITWKDINWQRKCLSINKTFVRLNNSRVVYIQSSPKTESSNRTIPLNNECISALKYIYASKDIFDENLKDAYVFEKPGSSSTITYESVRYHLTKVCEKAKVEYKGNHVFRHTFATNAYYKGANVKILSKMLGHADTSITYNTYIHLFGDALEEMRAIIE